MKVSDLIVRLQEQDPEALVVMSKDGEGNGFSPFFSLDKGRYSPESTWAGEFYGDDDEEMLDDDFGVTAICLWPIN